MPVGASSSLPTSSGLHLISTCLDGRGHRHHMEMFTCAASASFWRVKIATDHLGYVSQLTILSAASVDCVEISASLARRPRRLHRWRRLRGTRDKGRVAANSGNPTTGPLADTGAVGSGPRSGPATLGSSASCTTDSSDSSLSCAQ